MMPSHTQSFAVMSTTTGTSEFYSADADYNADVYIKLQKSGGVYISSYSPDGAQWTEITNKGTAVTQTNAKVTAAANLAVGFYAGSGGGSNSVGVTFSEFTYNGAPVSFAVDTAPSVEFSAAASVRCVARKAVLAVQAHNGDQGVLDFVFTSPFGTKNAANVAAGKNSTQSYTTRLGSVSAGSVSVTATRDDGSATRTIEVPYPAATCG